MEEVTNVSQLKNNLFQHDIRKILLLHIKGLPDHLYSGSVFRQVHNWIARLRGASAKVSGGRVSDAGLSGLLLKGGGSLTSEDGNNEALDCKESSV